MTFRGVDETVAEEIAILPGMEELFSLVRVAAWAEERALRHDRDRLRPDRRHDPHAGRARGAELLLLAHLPDPAHRRCARCARWPQRMTDMPIPTDDVFAAVQRIYQQMEGIGPLLQDPARSSIRIVLNPERMVINESQRLYTYLSLFGFPVDAIVANRVLPEAARSPYFDKWFKLQAGYLAEARRPSTRCRSSWRRSSTARWWAPRCSRSSAARSSATTNPAAVLHQRAAGRGQEGRPRLGALPAPAVRREGPHPGVRQG